MALVSFEADDFNFCSAKPTAALYPVILLKIKMCLFAAANNKCPIGSKDITEQVMFLMVASNSPVNKLKSSMRSALATARTSAVGDNAIKGIVPFLVYCPVLRHLGN